MLLRLILREILGVPQRHQPRQPTKAVYIIWIETLHVIAPTWSGRGSPPL